MALLHIIFLFISIINQEVWPPLTNRPALDISIKSTSIKIGLLVAKDPAGDTLSLSAGHGAELAIQKANKNGGFEGHPFELIVRTCDGPWGVTSKQMVNFVYEDEVQGIITSVDGRNAHLAEQVATKTQIPLISTRATDPTLSQAYVPWFFRVTPDDDLQTYALAEEIYKRSGLLHVVVLVQDTYDAKMSAQAFFKSAESLDAPAPRRIDYNPTAGHSDAIIAQLMSKEVEGVLFLGETVPMLDLMVEIEEKGHDISMFGMQSMLEKSNGSDVYSPEMFVSIPKGWVSQSSESFRKKFKEFYGYRPGISATYAYDAVIMLVEAIRNAGIDHQKIRESLSEMNYPDGVTGPVSFDEHGNRKGGVEIAYFPGGRLTGVREF